MAEPIGIDGDQIIASAVQYLIEGNEMCAAQLLLFCNIEELDSYPTEDFGRETMGFEQAQGRARRLIRHLFERVESLKSRRLRRSSFQSRL